MTSSPNSAWSCFFFSSRRRHTRYWRDWSSDVCSSDLDGDMLVFMDKENYEQVSLPKDLIGEPAAFLQDGMDVVMELYNERPISVQMPAQIEATIVEADAVVKGQTASSSYKPAILDNGVRVMVPPHITSGTRIVVDVYEQSYVRRAD